MSNVPLAERLRPKDLDAIIGQQHLIGTNAPLRKAIRSGSLPSMILWGPPGVGKTTLAQVISNELDRPFYTLSAISSGVKDIREVIQKAEGQGLFSERNSVLFIDEIHRFSKSQQDSLLGAVERGSITLIGATTENPSFEVISALLSRCQVYVLESLGKEELNTLVKRALSVDEELKHRSIKIQEDSALLRASGGDARKLLNVLEMVVNAQGVGDVKITDQMVMDVVQQQMANYDKNGELHYDIISAFIKSVRGSDPNAAIYWLARMVEGGEKPEFIARRLLILAAEDIGNANPTALIMANNTFDAISKIGWPEGRIVLAQCTIYLACSPKSNSAYAAIKTAQQEVRNSGDLSVPFHIRNAPTKLMKDLGYGDGYQYSHNDINNEADQQFLPDEISSMGFYFPGDNAREREFKKQLEKLWAGRYEF